MNEDQKEKTKQVLIDYFGEDAIPEHQWESLLADIEEIINENR